MGPKVTFSTAVFVDRARRKLLGGRKSAPEKIWPYTDLKTLTRMEEAKRRIVMGGTDLRSGDWFTWSRTKPVARLRGSRPGEASLFARRSELSEEKPLPRLADKRGARKWFNPLDSAARKRSTPASAAAPAAAPRIAEPLVPASTKLRSGVSYAARKRALANSGALAQAVSEQRNARHRALPTGMSRRRTEADELWHRGVRDVHWDQLSLHKRAGVATALDAAYGRKARRPDQPNREPQWLETREFVGNRIEDAITTRLAASSDDGAAKREVAAH